MHTLLESQSHPTLCFSHAGTHLLPALGPDARGQEPFFPCRRAPPSPAATWGSGPGPMRSWRSVRACGIEVTRSS